MFLSGATILDGETTHHHMAVKICGDKILDLLPMAEIPQDADQIRLDGGYLVPGLIDLQVNGGDGIMLDGTATRDRIARICAAHARLGATGIMPTLITDTSDATRAVIAAGIAAGRDEVAGFLGLHLEGPHLDPARHGAHDPALIRVMNDDDLGLLCDAARDLPALIVTLAPESVRMDQIATLRQAGAIVSLGHSDCSHDLALGAHQAGASMVTHVFNAMSQLSSRAPGLVGAGIHAGFDCGIIADGLHVHPTSIALAVAAKTQGRMFLVSDAMAVAGTDAAGFMLGGREILRDQGRLVLNDGTLAGADLTLPQAVAVMVEKVGISLMQAVQMASTVPADILGLRDRGRIAPGMRADLVHLGPDLKRGRVWQNGVLVRAGKNGETPA